MNALSKRKKLIAIAIALGIPALSNNNFALSQEQEVQQDLATSEVDRVDNALLDIIYQLLFEDDNMPFQVYANRAIALMKNNIKIFVKVLTLRTNEPRFSTTEDATHYVNDLITRLEQIKYTNSIEMVIQELGRWSYIAPSRTTKFINDHSDVFSKTKFRNSLKKRLSIPNSREVGFSS